MAGKTIILILTVFLCLVRGVIAQTCTNQIKLSLVTEKDGLVDNMPDCFFLDSHEKVWIGSRFGLNILDGSEVRTIIPSTNNISASKTINDVTEDVSGAIWIATSAGLLKYDYGIGAFTKYPCIINSDSETYNNLTSISAGDGQLWIGSLAGLLYYDINKNHFELFRNLSVDKHELSFTNHINKVFTDSKKRTWLCTYNGLWLFDKITHTFTSIDNSKTDDHYDQLVTDIIESHDGQIWIGTWSTGLKKWDQEHNRFLSFQDISGAPTCASSISEQKNADGTYSIWITKNFTRFDPEKTTFTAYECNFKGHVPENGISKIYCDRHNLLWVATSRGVHIYDPEKQFFETKIFFENSDLSSQAARVFSLNGNLLVTGQGGIALTLYDSTFHLLKNYTSLCTFRQNGKSFAPAVMNYAVNKNNNWWLSTAEGLVISNPQTGKQKVYRSNPADSSALPRNFINGVYFLKNGTIIVCPWRKGAWKFDETTGKFSPFLSHCIGPRPYNISKVLEDKNGNLWFSDFDLGLLKYETATGHTMEILPLGMVNNVYACDNEIWAVNHEAVYCIDGLTNKIKQWNLPAGRNKHTYDFLAKEKFLWIATKGALLSFDKQSGRFKEFTSENGLPADDLDGSLADGGDGTTWLLGNNYITRISDKILQQDNYEVPLGLTECELDGKMMPPGNLLQLGHSSRNLVLHWAISDLNNPIGNKYYYKLNGVNAGWQAAGNKGLATFNSLAPGDYEFLFYGVSSLGAYSKPKSIRIHVSAPVWARPAYQLAAIALIAFTTFIIVKRRIRNIRKEADLHQKIAETEMMALRAQINPHFIFNALNSIKGTILGGDEFEAAKYLDKFSKLIRMVLEYSRQRQITLAQEVEYLQLYLEIESFRFEGLAYEINCDKSINLQDVHLPAMLIQPFIENAIKHGLQHKQGRKELKVTMGLRSESELEVAVFDNGIGRKKSTEINSFRNDKPASRGMEITGSRLKILNLQSENNIIFTDHTDENGIATGTTVLILINLAG